MVLQPILRSTPVRSPRMSVRFASPTHPMTYSLSSYLRSPYPSAPFSPFGQTEVGSQWPKDRGADDFISHAHSTPLTTATSGTPKARRSSSALGRSIFSPTISSINRTKKPAPLDLEFRLLQVNESSINRVKKPAPLDLESRLSEDFWKSLSLEEAANSDDEPMVTALEYPESAVQYEGKMNIDAHQALLSPGIPRPSPALNKIRDSLMSPANRSSFRRIVRKDFTAPSPNDPFAAFPSFTAALAMGSSEGGYAYRSSVL